MTEAQWLTCADPKAMLEFVQGKTSDRKLRLFACQCVREYQRIMGRDAGLTSGIELTERYVDGLATRDEWLEGTRGSFHFGTWKSEAALAEALAGVQTAAGLAGWRHVSQYSTNQESAELRLLTQFVRDIFGNPFRPVNNPFRSEASCLKWRDGTIPKTAQTIYDERCTSGLPILADALEEAGCIDADILNHCRSDGQHVRGCWVIDQILGKQ